MDPSFYIMQYINVFYILVFFLILLFPYIFAYWRNDKESEKDTQIGVKVFCCYFLFLSLQLLLGLAAFAMSAIFSGGSITLREFHQFAPVIIICAIVGGLVFYIHKKLLEQTNYVSFSRIPRFYRGLNTFIVTFISIIAFTTFIFMMVNTGLQGLGKPLGMFLIYGSAWVYLASALFRNIKPALVNKGS